MADRGAHRLDAKRKDITTPENHRSCRHGPSHAIPVNNTSWARDPLVWILFLKQPATPTPFGPNASLMRLCRQRPFLAATTTPAESLGDKTTPPISCFLYNLSSKPWLSSSRMIWWTIDRTEFFSTSTTRFGLTGASYGSSTPVKPLISPARAFL